MEEIDLCWRLKSRGRKILCVPQSIVYHVGGGTLSVENPKKTYLNYRNNLLMIYKNIAPNKLTKVLITRWFLDNLAAIQLLLSAKPQSAKSIFKARSDFKRKKEVYFLKRKENLEKTTIKSPNGIYNKSIVFQYYIRNNKTFNQLTPQKHPKN